LEVKNDLEFCKRATEKWRFQAFLQIKADYRYGYLQFLQIKRSADKGPLIDKVFFTDKGLRHVYDAR